MSNVSSKLAVLSPSFDWITFLCRMSLPSSVNNSSIFRKALFASSLQINFSLLSAFSDGRCGSVWFCRLGRNLDIWFSIPIKDLSCFRDFCGCRAITASIFECFGLTPVSSISNPNQIRLVFEKSYLLYFKALFLFLFV